MPISFSDRWDTGRKPMWAEVLHVILSGLTTQSHSYPELNTSQFLSEALHFASSYLSKYLFLLP